MHHDPAASEECAVRKAPAPRKRERGVQLVVLLTAVMMTVEIVFGYLTNSMALLADGWHMATHVGALGLASVAYWASRRFAAHRAFAFGTGKIHALAGYTSAVALGLVAIAMVVESLQRLLRPHAIDFVASLPVAILGLIVNIVSVLLLDVQDDHLEDDHDGTAPSHHDHSHHHEHDHNHRAALMHVVADTFTSGLAIAALLAGRFLGWDWLDPVSGVVGGAVILHWGAGLLRNAAFELLDLAASPSVEDQIRGVLEALDDVRVSDLHVWPIGGGKKSCVVTLTTSAPSAARRYREALAQFDLAHLTVEVQRCEEGHEEGTRGAKLTNVDPNGLPLLSASKEEGCPVFCAGTAS